MRVSYALRGCRDNPEMESFHSRFKSENRSLLLDASTVTDLERVDAKRLTYYNGRRWHSRESFFAVANGVADDGGRLARMRRLGVKRILGRCLHL